MNKITVVAIIIILGAFGALIAFASLQSQDKTDYASYNSAKLIAGDENNGNIADHVRGKEDSKIIVVEYADLQCSGCASFMPKMSNIVKEYGDRVAFVFRNYPINGHQNARAAAAAVEAAGLQGYYWEMLENTFANQADWSSIYDTERRTEILANIFDDVANGEGDRNKFVSDLNNKNIQKKIDFDKNLGSKNDKVSATPSVFVNGSALDIEHLGERPIKEALEEMIDAELKKNGIETGPHTDEETSDKSETEE